MSNGFASHSKITIGIIANASQGWIGGANYILNLLKTVSALPYQERPNLIAIIVQSDIQSFPKSLRSISGIKVYDNQKIPSYFRLVPERYRDNLLTKYRYSRFENILRKNKIEFLFPLNWMYKPEVSVNVGWIPDFQHKHYPDFFSQEELEFRQEQYSWMAENCPVMIFSSQHAKEDFENNYSFYRSINFVYSFCTVLDEGFVPRDLNYLKSKYGLPDKFLYLPNQFWMHKNHLTVFKSLAQLSKSGYNIPLVCTGATNDHRNPEYFEEITDFLKKNNLNNVKILGLIPREDQLSVYYYAHAVIQPSLFEGWSSILEDARAFQKTVIASNIPVHREQNLPLVTYFDPLNIDDLKDKLADVWEKEPNVLKSYDQLWAEHQEVVLKTARSFVSIFEKAKTNI